jgi:hypothetical protein
MFDKIILPGYSQAQRASFENYLFSSEREKNLINNPGLMNAQERAQKVHHADVENWKVKEEKK